jgi:hypothetical protein
MNWYLAKFVYRIICGNGNHLPQFDEQLRLITARNKEEALNKAQQTGEREQESFYNQKQQLVQWQFIDISELYLLDELIDGAEIYSRIEEKEDAAGYIYTVHKKAENIRVSQHDRSLQPS